MLEVHTYVTIEPYNIYLLDVSLSSQLSGSYTTNGFDTFGKLHCGQRVSGSVYQLQGTRIYRISSMGNHMTEQIFVSLWHRGITYILFCTSHQVITSLYNTSYNGNTIIIAYFILGYIHVGISNTKWQSLWLCFCHCLQLNMPWWSWRGVQWLYIDHHENFQCHWFINIDVPMCRGALEI